MTTTLRCILLDDEIPGLTFLKRLCEQMEHLEVVKAYTDPLVFLNEYEKLSFDFCISDIEMPGMDGLELASHVKEHPIIFTTAYKEYAVHAFDINAVDYISKPVQKERLAQAIDKMRLRINSNLQAPAFTQFQSDKGKAIIYFEQIAFIENSTIDGRDKVMTLIDGNSLVIKNITFDKLLAQLPNADFIRINKKTIIAQRIVKYYTADEITANLFDAQAKPYNWPLSVSYRKAFLDRLQS